MRRHVVLGLVLGVFCFWASSSVISQEAGMTLPGKYSAIGERNPFEFPPPPPPPPVEKPTEVQIPKVEQIDPKVEARLKRLALTGILYLFDHYEAVFKDPSASPAAFVNDLRVHEGQELSQYGLDKVTVKTISDEDDTVILECFDKSFTYELRGKPTMPAGGAMPGGRGGPDLYQLGLSVQQINAALVKRYNLPVEEGIVAYLVRRGTPAEKAGLERGDVIAEVNGRQVKSRADIDEAVRSGSPGGAVTLQVLRGGNAQTITIQTGG